jgi:heptosyltransferase-2
MTRILVVAPSWVGDTVAAQPLLARLKQRRPGATLDVLAPPWVSAVLRRMPEVGEIIDNPFGHGEFAVGARRALGRRLRAAGYDEAIVLPNSWKSALVPWFAGIPKRTGYHGEARYLLLNDRRRLDAARLPQIAQRYAALADAPGGGEASPIAEPQLQSSPEQQQRALAALGLQGDHAPVACCPGAEYGPAKRWPSAYYADIARRLAARGHRVWLIGSAKDRPVADEITAAAGSGCRNLCGRTGLDQAIDLLAVSRFVLTNDSGLMHVAAALSRPLLALFGSSSPHYTPPLSAQAEVAWLALECSPCFARHCPLGHFRCMLELTPEQVFARIEARLPPAGA